MKTLSRTLITLALVSTAHAQTNPAEVEAAAAPEPTPAVETKAPPVSWKGDLRYRHEYISPGSSGAGSRNRNRIRARAALEAKPVTELMAVFGLATGDDADPISANATLSKGFAKKSVYLDLGYLDYAPADTGLHALAGRMRNPLHRPGGSELVFDSELNPEGLALRYERKLGESVELLTTVPFFWVSEEAGKDNDRYLVGVQVAARLALSDAMWARAGVAHYNFTDFKGRAVIDHLGSNRSFQNSTGAGNTYATHFQLINPFVEFGTVVGGMPATLFVEASHNAGADRDRLAWIVGLGLGEAKSGGDFAVKATWRRVERDAVVGAFSDSDFRGGGTDSAGLRASVEYAFSKPVVAGFSYFYNKLGVTNGADYNRAQLDLIVKF